MTCIVGYVEKGTVYMAADSAASNGDSICVRRDLKLFNLKNMLIGFCGSFRIGQILKYVSTIPKHPKGMDDHRFLCTHFVDYLIEVMEESRALQDAGGVASLGDDSQFLFGYKGVLYHFDNDMQVAVAETPYVSIGSGGQFATGAMFAMADMDIPPKDKLIKAVMAACENSVGVKPPVHVAIMDRKSCIKFL